MKSRYTKRLRTVGIYQLIVAFIGLLGMLFALVIGHPKWWLLIPVIVFGGVAGVLAAADFKSGLLFTVINQAIQVPVIGVGSFYYTCYSGIGIFSILSDWSLIWKIEFGTSLIVNPGFRGDLTWGANLVPVLVLVFLFTPKKQPQPAAA